MAYVVNKPVIISIKSNLVEKALKGIYNAKVYSTFALSLYNIHDFAIGMRHSQKYPLSLTPQISSQPKPTST